MIHTELGAMGEAYVARVLSRAGLRVQMGGPADLVVEGVPVEVKAARPGRRTDRNGHWFQFCLARKGKSRLRAPIVVLLCYWDPARELGRRRKVIISGDPWTYRGRWARWYRRWDVVADALAQS